MFIAKELINSRAWLDLSGIAKDIYLLLCCRRKSAKTNHSRRGKYVIPKDQKIKFPYEQAGSEFHMTRPRFSRGIDDLYGHGFINISYETLGNKAISLYDFADDWKSWGTPEFKRKPREKIDQHGRGFAYYWKQQKKNVSNENVTGAGNKNVTGKEKASNKNVTGKKGKKAG